MRHYLAKQKPKPLNMMTMYIHLDTYTCNTKISIYFNPIENFHTNKNCLITH